MKKREEKSDSDKEEDPLAILNHLHRDMHRAILQNIGVSYSRMLVLHELYHEGEISQAELQQRIGMEGALLTRYAKQMEKAGLITRRVDPEDNRFTLVTLAPAGLKYLREVERLGEDYEARLLEGLDKEELAVMIRALKRIRDNLARYAPRKQS